MVLSRGPRSIEELVTREQPRVGWDGLTPGEAAPTHALPGTSHCLAAGTMDRAVCSWDNPIRALQAEMPQCFSLDVPGGTAGVLHPWDIPGTCSCYCGVTGGSPEEQIININKPVLEK